MSWFEGTALADLQHRQQHGFDTWDDAEWQETYAARSPDEVHDRDHEIRPDDFDHGHDMPAPLATVNGG
jgi:hypothetical protein